MRDRELKGLNERFKRKLSTKIEKNTNLACKRDFEQNKIDPQVWGDILKLK